MIKYKGSPINFPPLEHPVVLIITDNVVEAKRITISLGFRGFK